jgi:hypothetical protein
VLNLLWWLLSRSGGERVDLQGYLEVVNQEQAIGFATRWTFDLTAEDDQLLTKQRIFRDEVCLGAGKVGQRSSQWRATGWPCPLEQALVQATRTVVDMALERDEQT